MADTPTFNLNDYVAKQTAAYQQSLAPEWNKQQAAFNAATKDAAAAQAAIDQQKTAINNYNNALAKANLNYAMAGLAWSLGYAGKTGTNPAWIAQRDAAKNKLDAAKAAADNLNAKIAQANQIIQDSTAKIKTSQNAAAAAQKATQDIDAKVKSFKPLEQPATDLGKISGSIKDSIQSAKDTASKIANSYSDVDKANLSNLLNIQAQNIAKTYGVNLDDVKDQLNVNQFFPAGDLTTPEATAALQKVQAVLGLDPKTTDIAKLINGGFTADQRAALANAKVDVNALRNAINPVPQQITPEQFQSTTGIALKMPAAPTPTAPGYTPAPVAPPAPPPPSATPAPSTPPPAAATPAPAPTPAPTPIEGVGIGVVRPPTAATPAPQPPPATAATPAPATPAPTGPIPVEGGISLAPPDLNTLKTAFDTANENLGKATLQLAFAQMSGDQKKIKEAQDNLQLKQQAFAAAKNTYEAAQKPQDLIKSAQDNIATNQAKIDQAVATGKTDAIPSLQAAINNDQQTINNNQAKIDQATPAPAPIENPWAPVIAQQPIPAKPTPPPAVVSPAPAVPAPQPAPAPTPQPAPQPAPAPRLQPEPTPMPQPTPTGGPGSLPPPPPDVTALPFPVPPAAPTPVTQPPQMQQQQNTQQPPTSAAAATPKQNAPVAPQVRPKIDMGRIGLFGDALSSAVKTVASGVARQYQQPSTNQSALGTRVQPNLGPRAPRSQPAWAQNQFPERNQQIIKQAKQQPQAVQQSMGLTKAPTSVSQQPQPSPYNQNQNIQYGATQTNVNKGAATRTPR